MGVVNASERSAMMSIALGYMSSQAVYVAARLGLADLVASGLADTDALAAEIGADPANTGRLLRALTASGVLRQLGPDEFALTPEGRLLCTGVPDSVRDFVQLYCSPAVWRAWAELTDTVRTGRTAFETEHGMGAFAYCAAEPEVGALFHRAMAEDASQVAALVAQEYGFEGVSTVADVGGGNGTLIAAVLARRPGLRGILFDTAQGVTEAAKLLTAAGVRERCTIVAGDFFAEVPAADLHLLKSTVHDWNDADAARILRTCRAAAAADGRLLLVERVLPTVLPSVYDPHAVRHQLAGPVIMGGHERTAEEFQKLLGSAGYELVHISEPLGETGYHLIEGRPA